MSSNFHSALVVSRTFGEVRVALIQDRQATSFYIERARDRGIVGNIYKGRVVRVVPGMQSAFVDVGLERAAFLYVGDVRVPEVPGVPGAASPDPGSDTVVDQTSPVSGDEPTWADASRVEWKGSAEVAAGAADDLMALVNGSNGTAQAAVDAASVDAASVDAASVDAASVDAAAVDADAQETLRPGAPPRTRRARPPVEELLHPGQELLVQVSKEALGTKGARLTTQLAVPGRFLVRIANNEHVGVSRRIVDEEERERLRDLVERHRLDGEGFIVRTACEGRAEDILAADMEFLRELWAETDARSRRMRPPALLHEELDLVLRAIRDLMTDDVAAIHVDDEDDYARLAAFLERFMPRYRTRLHLHTASEPLMVAAGVERAVGRALGRRVRLPSGGYIVIDHTEALTSIDVNSGRYTGGKNLEETTYRVNLEAAAVIAAQLRLRDIGGLIVVDFIDMEEIPHREAVYVALADAMVGDSARCSMLPISEFGLLEMTRRRVRDDLARNLLGPCSSCDGRGHVKTAETVAYEVLRELIQVVRKPKAQTRGVQVRCEDAVAEQLLGREGESLRALGADLGRPIEVLAQPHFARERFEVAFRNEAAASSQATIGGGVEGAR